MITTSQPTVFTPMWNSAVIGFSAWVKNAPSMLTRANPAVAVSVTYHWYRVMTVRVSGFCSMAFESKALFASSADHRDARTERALNDRHGTGQSALDGIVRASNVLLAGNTVVVVGYGWAGLGVAERARGAGAAVIVCEIDPLRALEARMAGYEVMPALVAAERGDLFITVTGSRRVLRRAHFERMKDGVLLANAGHFDVELDLAELAELAGGEVRAVRPLVSEYRQADGRRLNLLAHGRVVNLAAAEGHPAAVMDVSFALQALGIEQLVRDAGSLGPGVHAVSPAVDREVGRLKLAALGVQIDEPTDEQTEYLSSWGALGASPS